MPIVTNLELGRYLGIWGKISYSRHSRDSNAWRVRRFRICSSGRARLAAFWKWTEAWVAAARRGRRTSGQTASYRWPSTPDRSSSTWFRCITIEFTIFFFFYYYLRLYLCRAYTLTGGYLQWIRTQRTRMVSGGYQI